MNPCFKTRIIMIKFSAAAIASCLFFNTFLMPAFAADQILPGETLDINACIKIALKNHPSIQAAASNIVASENRTGQAKSLYWPQVNVQFDYSRYNQPSSIAGVDPALFDNYNSAVTLNQLIYDFGRTQSQVKVNKFATESSQADMRNTSSDVVHEVKVNYYTVLQARDTREANRETVRQFEEHLDMAKKLYETGIKPMIDVTKAEVDLSQARLNLIKADNNLKVSMEMLANSIGLNQSPEFNIKDADAFRDFEINFNSALDRAYNNRPDLKSLEARYAASKSSIDLARSGHYPTMSGEALYGYTGNAFPLDSEWNLGAFLSIPIFSGFNVNYKTGEARANLKTAGAGIELLKQNIRLGVKKAIINLDEIKKAMGVASLGVSQARENREMAEGRYAEGLGNSIEITDAYILELNSKTAYANVIYNYWIALANLEKEMGETL
jgi:outer membrane protein